MFTCVKSTLYSAPALVCPLRGARNTTSILAQPFGESPFVKTPFIEGKSWHPRVSRRTAAEDEHDALLGDIAQIFGRKHAIYLQPFTKCADCSNLRFSISDGTTLALLVSEFRFYCRAASQAAKEKFIANWRSANDSGFLFKLEVKIGDGILRAILHRREEAKPKQVEVNVK